MQSTVEDITADIQHSEYLRLLGVFPVSRSAATDDRFSRGNADDHGIEDVAYAYAYEPKDEPARYFAYQAGRAGSYGPRREFTTPLQAINACLYHNGFGGKTPEPIRTDW